jgi:hypothetical protein
MSLFILINYPYYSITYGKNTNKIIVRTFLLNSVAILIGWFPVVFYWPNFSQKFLLPAICVIGALGCVGSRFLYQELIPEELAKVLIEYIDKNHPKEKSST